MVEQETKFNKAFFKSNRERLFQSNKTDVYVVAGNGLLQRSGDTNYRFRQDSNFWYLTGLDEPDLLLVIKENESLLVLPERKAHRDLWEGKISEADLKNRCGADSIISHRAFLAWLKTARKSGKALARLKPADSYIANHGMFTNPARAKLEVDLQTAGVKLSDCRLELARLRQVKQAAEVDCIKQAVNITCDTFNQVKAHITDYHNEAEVERAISRAFLDGGLSEHAYHPIIATGKNATTLHYVKNNHPIRKTDLLLIDAGAESEGYAADITRTWAISKPSKRQTLVHSLVLEIQNYAFENLRLGMLMKDYEKLVRDFATKTALAHKLIQNSKDINSIYPHATSHFLGLDVHDAADYDMPLTKNMVLTVEPGVYLAMEGIGVRIEDDVLLTSNGADNLGASLPKSL